MGRRLRKNFDWSELQAEKELRRWGNFHKRQVFYSHIKCNLAELVELGMHIPSGYATTSHYYPDILQTERVWYFMPARWMQAVYVHYVYDTTIPQKALALGISTNQFRRRVRKGFRFYAKYRDTNFSALN